MIAVIAINLSSAFHTTRLAIPGMRAKNWGRVINLSGSMEPRAVNAASPAKAALHLWSKGLSCDVAGEGITVNVIATGRINSAQILDRLHPTEESRREFIARNIPMGRFGDPIEIANGALFLASDESSWMTGQSLIIDGGITAAYVTPE